MDNKMTKKLLVILMIIMILATDFFALGSSLITYANQIDSETSNQNIEFSVYFKEGENRVDSVEKSIKYADLKLYAEIVVNSEDGYLEKDSTIEILDSNFNIISTNKGVLDGNKVKLNQISAGEKVEVELGIEPQIFDKITTDFLSKTSIINFTGKYIYSQAEEGIDVKASKSVCVNYQPDETTGAELKTEIITNKILAVNGTNQRIVQLLIKSGLTNNEYPVKETTLNVTIPQLSETTPEVSVLATNGTTQVTDMTTESGTLQIKLNNEADSNNQINWNKNDCNEMVVTYVYPETVDASKVEITTNSEIKLYNSGNTYTATYTKGIENQEPNGVILGKTEITTEELYKGKLYANIDTPYSSNTTIVITDANVADKVVIHEGADALGLVESKLETNTKYITTKINLEKMLELLGQDGYIEIKNGEVTTTINKNTAVDENGDVVINHENSTSELDIITSKPVKTGILQLNHTKVVTGNSYTREQLKEVKTLNVKNTILATLENQEIVNNLFTTSKELKETTSKAELTIDKTTFSATEANEVTVGIKLITDGEKYDLYKNPSISLQMPQAVENVEFIEEPSKLYADEFGAINKNYDLASKTVTISMDGVQTAYPESSLMQTYIQLKLKITLSKFALSQTDKITMTYRNENPTQYDNGTAEYGVIEQSIEISSPSELIKMFNISLNENTSLTEKILQKVKQDDAGKEVNFNIELLNNKDTEINNVKILGKLPTTGNGTTGEESNTLETILKSVNAENATIYYTENVEATDDIEDTANGWTTDLTTLRNVKLYLLKLDSLARGQRYTATVTIQMPTPITENGLSYTEYEVIYDTTTDTEVRENSRKIGLISSSVASIKVETTAQVGKDTLNNGDAVKEGEVIKYTVTVKNNGAETLNNVQLKLDVPEGSVYVKPIEEYTLEKGTEFEEQIEVGGYAYSETYYEEIVDSEKLAQLTNITIPELTTTEAYTTQYEVRVNKGADNTEISNKATITYDDSSLESAELTNIIKESNVRVTIKKAMDESIQLLPNGVSRYDINVENMSDTTIKNLEMQIILENFDIEYINDEEEIAEKLQIDEIKPNGINTYEIYGNIYEDAKDLSIYAIVNNAEGEKYRSNLITETIPKVDATINMSSPQNGQYIKEGDTVEYNINVKNTSDIEGVIHIYDIIPEYLEVQSVQNQEEEFSNNIEYEIQLKPQEEIQVGIIAKVRYIPKLYHGKTITNMATISVFDVKEFNSQIVTHILKSSEIQDDNVENVISGFAWFDENGNGRRDVYEEAVPGITVKLFNTATNKYVANENGNFIEIKTDNYGQYTFTKIENGSYLVVFEYETEKYALTTSFADGVDTSLNSKVGIKNINTTRVAAIEINDLKENVFNMNIGLKENTGDVPKEEQPGIIQQPENPTNPEKPSTTEKPGETETPELPEETKNQKTISGLAWLDSNRDGKKDDNENLLSGIKVKIYDVTTKNYLKDGDGNIVETITDNDGKYIFNNIEKGFYILIFEYNVEEYEPTKYMAEGVASTKNSKAILNNININGQDITIAVTDTINVEDDISDINIGLKEKLIFDLELNKYITKIVVQNSKGTKTYDYDKKSLAKVEINKKQLQGSLVVIEYTIKVKNTGEISGYTKNIVDYLPSGLTFSSELNKEWYLLDNNLYTKSLENVELKPGEEKEVKLILTKTMTNENVGLINNRAEIYEDYNKYGEKDIDSIPNNQNQNEDDMNAVDLIIGISTGGSNILYIIVLMINLVLIGIAIKLMIKNRIIKISTKRKRR